MRIKVKNKKKYQYKNRINTLPNKIRIIKENKKTITLQTFYSLTIILFFFFSFPTITQHLLQILVMMSLQMN